MCLSSESHSVDHTQIGIDLAGSDVSEEQLAKELVYELDQEDFIDSGFSSSLSITVYYTCDSVPVIFSRSSYPERFSCVQMASSVSMTDTPLSVVRKKKDSTLIRILQDLSQKRIQACVSASNTGALVVASSHILGRMDSVRHPPLVVELPSRYKESSLIFLDVGATPQLSERDAVVYAFLGAFYVEATSNIIKPKVSLLNIGIEAIKGPKLIKKIHTIFSQFHDDLPFDFQGNVEPYDIFSEHAPDVVVTSGFAGNIFLKTAEALLMTAKIDASSLLSSRTHSKPIRQAALLAGVQGLVYKCHGKASGKSLKDAILQAYQAIEKEKLLSFIHEKLKQHTEKMEELMKSLDVCS